MSHRRLPLNELTRGQRGVIAAVKFGPECAQLCCMGVREGAEVETLRSISRGHMSVYRIDGLDVALRRETAGTITVTLETA